MLFLVAFPLWVAFFLTRNRDKLIEEGFKQRFETLYQGIKVGSLSSLYYNAVFAVRRFDIVLVNLFFSIDSPLSGAKRSFHLFKVLSFMGIQTMYLFFIHNVHPHNDSTFNKLELVNEYCMVALAYLSLNFVNIVQVWNYTT